MVAAGVVCALSGCGTVNNLACHGLPYGGVRADTNAAAELAASCCLCECRYPVVDAGAAAYLLAIDLPLSAVADTLSLPLTVSWELERARKGVFAERLEDPPQPEPIRPPPDAPSPQRSAPADGNGR
jgi:uncharacterized protein YceK